MMQDADRKSQIEDGSHRWIQQIADYHVSVWQVPRVRESHEGTATEVHRDDSFRPARCHDRGMPPLSATALEDHLAGEVRGCQRRHPVKKLLFVIVAKLAPARPFLRKPRSRLEFDGGEVGGEKNRYAVADGEIRTAIITSRRSGHQRAVTSRFRRVAFQGQPTSTIRT